MFDTVDGRFGEEWLNNIQNALQGRTPDYLIVQHMEPDHSANVVRFLSAYPTATVVADQRAFVMMKQFFKEDYPDRRMAVKD